MELIHIKGDTFYLAADESIPLYRVDSGHCILLDSGLESEREELCQALDGAGLVPVGILGSHTHLDHSVNNFWLRERYGTKVCMTGPEAALSSSNLMAKSIYFTMSTEMMVENYGGMVGKVDEIIGPEDGVAEFCGVPFHIIQTPGHTPGHICTVTPDNVCYTADLMLAESSLATARLLYHCVHSAARESMKKMQGRSFDAVIAAHRGLVEDLDAAAEANLATMDEECRRIYGLMTQPMTMHEIVVSVFEEKKLLTSQPVKAAKYWRNVQCYLEYMVDDHQLGLEAKRGICRYVRN